MCRHYAGRVIEVHLTPDLVSACRLKVVYRSRALEYEVTRDTCVTRITRFLVAARESSAVRYVTIVRVLAYRDCIDHQKAQSTSTQ